MFPFNLPGPQFLLFYVLFALAVLIICWFVTRMTGGSTPKSYADLMGDPYQIAYLRGGQQELIRVAVFNLVDRGILVHDGRKVRTAERFADSELRRPFDRILVSQSGQPIATAELLGNTALKVECDKYKADLERRGMLPDASARQGHLRVYLIALGTLAGVATIKVAIALASGRTNVAILIIFAVFFSMVAIKACVPRISPSGHATLRGLRTLLKRLRGNAGRLRAGGRTNEALLLAAVAGLAALPASEFAEARKLFPVQSSGGGDSSGGSSCSSGSSGCGGGGGCGGCGG